MGSSVLPKRFASPAGRPGRESKARTLSGQVTTLLGVVSLLLGTFGAGVEVSGDFLPWLAQRTGHRAPPRLVVTAPDPQWASFASERLAPNTLFQAEYTAHGGTAVLGPALTPAIPVSGGWMQFYRSGALFLPGQTPASVGLRGSEEIDLANGTDSAARLLSQGHVASAGHAVLLPVLQTLLAAGSTVGISDPSSSISYVSLRQAAEPNQQIRAPSWYAPDHPTGLAGTFVPEGRRGVAMVGHLIPPAVWNALNQANVAPDGWQQDFGMPLTEALAGSALPGGHVEQITVQVFERGAIVLRTPTGSSGQSASPSVQPLSVGLDYLETFGPPRIVLASGTHLWATDSTAISQTADPASATVAHVGLRFPLTIASDVAAWKDGKLWYYTMPQGGSLQHAGWIPADTVTFTSPGDGPAWAGLDALDPDLGAYVAGLGSHVGALVYDLTRQRYYYYNDQAPFIVASSVKVPIMISLLAQLEKAGRGPDSNEAYLLTTMIENSDNDSAQALYEEIGDAPGLTAYMQQFGVAGLSAAPGAWGWSTITPRAMVQLLTLLFTGQVLTPQDRALALNLMENVESDQQTGVGTTAPAGATVALKDGWVTGPDNLWVMNSSGVVVAGRETYIISVYTTGLNDLSQGWDITEHVCRVVAQRLA